MELKLPRGFRFAGVACGVKESQLNDLSLICADENCIGVGVYTQNVVRAPSVVRNESLTPSQQIKAIVTVSGNANACTGEQGSQNDLRIAELTAQAIGAETSPNSVLVLSTGIIGVQLPMEQIEQGIKDAGDRLGTTEEHFIESAKAILTSDNGMKVVSKQFDVDGEQFSIVGMAKGAGMIGPRMATMLCNVVTDYPLSTAEADSLLRNAVNASFNRISVEGHTSTNDAVILLCPGGESRKSSTIFSEQLNSLCIELAKKIPSDGEGASHLVEICVSGAESDELADRLARAIASSNLVKTAITGNDPNWGRIVSALGILDVKLDVKQIGLQINGHTLFDQGQPISFSEEVVSRSLADNFEVKIEVTVGDGVGRSIHWTSDLTKTYVHFNSEYTT